MQASSAGLLRQTREHKHKPSHLEAAQESEGRHRPSLRSCSGGTEGTNIIWTSLERRGGRKGDEDRLRRVERKPALRAGALENALLPAHFLFVCTTPGFEP